MNTENKWRLAQMAAAIVSGMVVPERIDTIESQRRAASRAVMLATYILEEIANQDVYHD